MKNSIDAKTQKKLLINLLQVFDQFCEKNHIQYSLIGGSLIGAIRHQGIIPWDDDIDVILMPEEYSKLIKAIENFQNKNFYFLLSDTNDNYYPFIKLIDKRTILHEDGVKEIKDYGVYLDIFKYNYAGNHYFSVLLKEKMRILYKNIYGIPTISDQAIRQKSIKVKILYRALSIFNFNKLMQRRTKILNSSKNKPTKYIISNWAGYKAKKEIQLTSSCQKYQRVKFENITAMITSDYDPILRTTFGDYMQLPPASERIPKHNTKIWWRPSHNSKDL